MKNLTYILLFIASITFGQKIKSETDDYWKTIDTKNTSELIRQILNDEKKDILQSNCISRKPLAISTLEKGELKKIAKKELLVSNSSYLRKQIRLYEQFVMTENIVSNKDIVEIGDFEIYPVECDSGYCSISKPIFNETFDIAFIQIGYSCGMLCGYGIDRIYMKKNGIWTIKKIMSTWIK